MEKVKHFHTMKDKDLTRGDALREKPGAAVDKADEEDVTKKMVDQETRILNNNPRTCDDKMP